MPNIPVAPGGRGAAVARPPGATRSGENDEFGRGVIRALRQTMPSPNGQLGRVTVKLLLSNTGNLAEVQLIRSAGIPGLDQSVVFAVKQASFPIPPGGATARRPHVPGHLHLQLSWSGELVRAQASAVTSPSANCTGRNERRWCGVTPWRSMAA